MALLLALLACTPDPGEPLGVESPCAEDEVLEGTRCLPAACGVGVWGDLPVDEADLFVDHAAPEGGDGSLEAPFRSLEEALDQDRSARVMLAEGRYEGQHILWGGSARGRCKELVTVAGEVALSVWGDGSVESLSVEGMVGVEVVAATVELRDLDVVAEQEGLAFYAYDHVPAVGFVEDITVRQSGWASGVGLLVSDVVEGTSLLEGRDVRVESEGLAALWLQGARVDLQDLEVAVGEGEEDGMGFALTAEHGAELTCTRCRFTGARGAAVVVSGAEATLVDSVVEEVSWDAGDGGDGVGVLAPLGGVITLRDSELRDIDGYGVAAVQFGEVLVDGLHITGIGGDEIREIAAVYAESGGWVHGSGLRVTEVRGAALAAENQGYLELADVQIQEIAASIDVQGEAMAGPGLYLNDSGAVLEDLLVSGATTYALVVQDHSTLDLRGGLVQATREYEGVPPLDVLVQGSSLAWLEELTLSGDGHGLIVHDGAWAYPNRLRLDPSAGVGVVVLEGGGLAGSLDIEGRTGWAVGVHRGVLELWDSLVQGTVRDEERSLATAVAVADAEATLDRVRVEDTQGIGLALEGGSLLFRDGEVLRSQLAGAFTSTGLLSLVDAVVSEVSQEDTAGLGVGVAAVTDPERSPGLLSMQGSAVSGASHAAVWLAGQGHEIVDSALVGGPRASLLGGWVHGDALMVEHGDVSLAGVTLEGAQGVGLLLHHSEATLDGVVFQDNAEDLLQQACEGIEPIEPPHDVDARICPSWDEPVLTLDFYNAVRLDEAE